MKTFREDLQTLINMHSKENGSDTPDFVLAKFLDECLVAFDAAVIVRELRKDSSRDSILKGRDTTLDSHRELNPHVYGEKTNGK